MQIGVARNPPLEHAFARLLRHLVHNNRRSRVERRSTLRLAGKQSRLTQFIVDLVVDRLRVVPRHVMVS